MISEHEGILEIDHLRGVIYFHEKTGSTLLRICRLGKIEEDISHIDITHMFGKTIYKENT